MQCFLVANDNFSVAKFDYCYFFPCITSILAFIVVIWFGLIFPIMSLNILDTAWSILDMAWWFSFGVAPYLLLIFLALPPIFRILTSVPLCLLSTAQNPRCPSTFPPHTNKQMMIIIIIRIFSTSISISLSFP